MLIIIGSKFVSYEKINTLKNVKMKITIKEVQGVSQKSSPKQPKHM
jgi:hypothetical protein